MKDLKKDLKNLKCVSTKIINEQKWSKYFVIFNSLSR